jgi:uncharacterized protein (DUF305 family)
MEGHPVERADSLTAVAMSQTLLAKDNIPPDVQAFAQKVIDVQGPEIERMNTMLKSLPSRS